MTPSKTAREVRSAFLDYFRRQGHEVVPSGPLIPPNDPTLMFANAGMVQFKDVFTGRERRPHARAASSQKCIRISGKHNDLENVGRTARHHTFFEMLGNFSFGDYFKQDAIAFAWELLTRELGLDPSRMVVTVFGGEQGVAADDEARAIWRKVSGFGDERVIGLGMKDNFWQMGETGPCGPCSEVHYAVGQEPDLGRFGEEPDASGRGWVEIWNLVFMQFERSVAGGAPTLAPLPAPCVDTGAGLERLSAVLQGVSSNYDTDVLRPLVERAASIGAKHYAGSAADDDTSMRVIADHARAAAFLVAEGVVPDRDGRPYVLRRVMRRAVRHGHRLGIERPFLHEVALEVVGLMHHAYPELAERADMIRSVVEQEEARFRETLARGLRILEEEFSDMRARGSRVLGGDAAFRLYDTYGFPLDLTQVICDERVLEVDVAGYEQALAAARARSEGSKVGEAEVGPVWRAALSEVPGGRVQFAGYEHESAEATVVALVRDGALVDRAEPGERVDVVLDVTPFYGEAGGQVGDKGTLLSGPIEACEVLDARKPLEGLTAHVALVREPLSVGARVRAVVDHDTREATRRNHSATHLLHFALRKVLGAHAQQKGSLVGPDRLRFDFTHPKGLEPDEILAIENLVNLKIMACAPVETRVLPIEEARKLGAMAIFEEKYGEVVRVLTMTPDSVELCGGTHARSTGEIGFFKIVSETGIAAGVRRIEAATGWNALGYVRGLEETLRRAAHAARAGGADLGDKIDKLVAHERELEKQVGELMRKLALGGAGGGVEAMLARARDMGGVKVLSVRAEVADAAALRETAEKLRDKLGASVVFVGAAAGGKAMLAATVSKGLTAKIRAGEIIRPVAQMVGGSGGGRPDMAQAGGTDVGRLDEALEAAYGVVSGLLSG
jgi:alanyl-tRNA synthetase